MRHDDKVFIKLPGVHKLKNDDVDYDHIQVYVYFDKRAKMPTMLASIVKVNDERGRPDGMGMFSTSCMIMSAPSERYPLESAAWGRDNSKKMAAHLEAVAASVEAKSGPQWDNIVAFAAKYGIKLEAASPVRMLPTDVEDLILLLELHDKLSTAATILDPNWESGGGKAVDTIRKGVNPDQWKTIAALLPE